MQPITSKIGSNSSSVTKLYGCDIVMQRETIGLVYVLISVLSAAADDAEDKAVNYVKQVQGKIIYSQNSTHKIVIGVDLELSSKVSDSNFKGLIGLKNLQSLNLSYTNMTDEGISNLVEFPLLQSLDFNYTNISDKGLKVLENLSHLCTLHLKATQVTDVGLKSLIGLDQLRVLILARTNVTDMGTKDLVKLKNLKSLNLGLTKISDVAYRACQIEALRSFGTGCY